MEIRESNKAAEHQNHVNNFCQHIISNNQVQSVHVQQEGEYLNINIKIKIDSTKIHQNIQNSDNQVPNLRQETPATSTQIVDNTFTNTIQNTTSHQHIDSITYERFREQLVAKKHDENRQISPNQGTTNNLKVHLAKKSDPQQQTSQRVGFVRPMMTNQGMTLNHLPVQRSPSLQILPQFQQQRGIKHNYKFHGKGHAKMLVILSNGEQRLITFTLPTETCTVQDLFKQVGIETNENDKIECIENPGSEIDYVVKVGNFGTRDITEMTKDAENHIRQQAAQQKTVQQPVNDTRNNPSTKLPPPKYVGGFYAVCSACGFSGSDHAKCERCHRTFTKDVKTVRKPEKYGD